MAIVLVTSIKLICDLIYLLYCKKSGKLKQNTQKLVKIIECEMKSSNTTIFSSIEFSFIKSTESTKYKKCFIFIHFEKKKPKCKLYSIPLYIVSGSLWRRATIDKIHLGSSNTSNSILDSNSF